MCYKVSLSTQAKADIQTAYDYIHEHSPQAAERWFRLLLSEMESLRELPTRCALVPEASQLEFEITKDLCKCSSRWLSERLFICGQPK